MKYTLQELFEVIDERKEKEEFYYALSSGGWGANYYLNRITSFTPDEKIIISSNRNQKELDHMVMKQQEVEIDGFLLYEYISHTEEYQITRLLSLNEATNIICSEKGLLNMFTGDMIVIENGKRKKFYVKDASGRLLSRDDIDRKRHGIKFLIEWC